MAQFQPYHLKVEGMLNIHYFLKQKIIIYNNYNKNKNLN